MLIDELKLIIESIKKRIPKKLSDLENDLYYNNKIEEWILEQKERVFSYDANYRKFSYYEEFKDNKILIPGEIYTCIIDEVVCLGKCVYTAGSGYNGSADSYNIEFKDESESKIIQFEFHKFSDLSSDVDDGMYIRLISGYDGYGGDVTVDIGIVRNKVELQQLDENVIPDTIARISDIPKIAQPDWDQNDESAVDYVKNRTHYTEFVDGNILLDNLTSEDYYNALNANSPIQCRIIPGNTYKVIWNNEVYDNLVCSSLSSDYKHIGEREHPFFIMGYDLAHADIYDCLEILDSYSPNAEFTISLIEKTEEIKKLDEKYIPETIARMSDIAQSDWSQNDKTASNYIQNRTHYEEIALEVIFDREITVNHIDPRDSSKFYYEIPTSSNFNLENGVSYIITLGDRTETGTINNKNCLATGSDIEIRNGNYKGLIGDNTGEFTVPFTTRFTLSKVCDELVVHQLDEKFIPDTIARLSNLPQSDWDQNDDTVSDYIKNRTHYTYLVDGNTLVDNLTSEDYENGVNIPQCNFIPGNIYKVIWNGEVYDNLVCIFDGTNIIGGEGYPFYIDDYEGLYISSNDDSSQFTVSVIEKIKEFKQLDEKFIPDAIARKEYVDTSIADNMAIVDVVELPTENINENTFYRLLCGYFVRNQYVQIMYKCHCVNGLPSTGEPATNVDQSEGNIYYNLADGEVYGYVDAILSAGLGVPSGWYTASVLLGTLGFQFNGIITDLQEDPLDDSFSLLLYHEIYNYKNKWIINNTIGKSGAGQGAEIFNYSLNTASGYYSHAEGKGTTASGITSHAEGSDTTTSGDYSHAEGKGTTASGQGSHAEGAYSEAIGIYSHAEGNATEAYGARSHAEGIATKASGENSHAEGNNTQALGKDSHAEGSHTIASSEYQHVQGKHNIEDAENKYAHIIGNGKPGTGNKSNAHTVDWSGNAWYAGDVYVGGSSQDDGKKLVTEESLESSVNELSVQVAYIDTEDNEDVADTEAVNIIVDSKLSTTSTNPVQNKVITEKFSELSEQIVDLKDGNASIPDYWKTHLDEKIALIKQAQDKGGKEAFSYIVITDIHYPSNLGKLSPLLAKYIMDRCDIKFVLILGDLRTRGLLLTKEDCETEWNNIYEMLKPIYGRMLLTQGNHDAGYGKGDYDGDGDTDNYAYEFTPEEMFNRVYRKASMCGDVHYDASGTAYYIDDESNKVRYILLNTQLNFDGNKGYSSYETVSGMAKYPSMWKYRYTQCQYDFLINDALKTVPSDDYKVVMGSHVPINQTGEMPEFNVMVGVLQAYKNKTTYSGTYEGTASGGSTANFTNMHDPSDPNCLDNKYLYNDDGKTLHTGASEKYFVSAYIPAQCANKNADIIRASGIDPTEDVHCYAYDSSLNTLVGAHSTAYNDITFDDNGIMTWKAGYENNYISTSPANNLRYIRVSGTKLNTIDDIVITVNEEITYTEGGGAGYDAVSVNCDFTNAKGNLVAYHGGHNHKDTSSFSCYQGGTIQFPIITTRCDGKQENDDTKNERVEGTVTEQSFDVFTNTPSKLYATKIGAGSDRVISY